MKKNFFKKLSFVMALAMIISVIAPAAGAFAATGAYLNATKKYLYLNEEGKLSEYDFNIKNKPAGSASYTWTSDNTDVATVESPSGVVTAQAKGTAKITVVIKDKAGKKLKTLYARVYVRDNMESIKISNFTDKTVVKVGEPFDFNRTFVTFAGSTTSTTSITRYAVDNDKATINATTGVFTATEAGEFNVTAYAFASTYEYTKWLADKAEKWVLTSDTVKVTVAPSITKAELVTPTQVKITFDSSVKDTVKSKADVVINQKVTDTITAMVPVKSLDSVSADGKEVVVSVYDNLVNATTYKVTAATSTYELYAQIGTPTSISMDNQVAPIGTYTVKFVLKDQYGVDVSSLFVGSVNKSSSIGWANSTAGTLTFGTAGQVAFINLSYDVIKADGTIETISTGTHTVTCVATTVTGALENNLSTGATNDAAAFATADTAIAVGSTTPTYLHARALQSDGNYNYSGYTFESMTPSVLMVDKATGLVSPLTVGTALVKAFDINGNVAGYFNVTVTAESATASVKVSSSVVKLSNSYDVAGTPTQESATVTVTNVDQYGTETAADVVSADCYVANASRSQTVANVLVGAHGVTFTALAGQTGSFVYVIKTDEGKAVSVTVTVATPGNLSTFNIESTETAIDLYAANTDTVSTVDFTVYGLDVNGYKKSLVISGSPAVSYTVTGPNNFSETLTDGDSNGTVTFDLSDLTDTSAKAGTYTLNVSIGGIVIQKSFTVNNTRPGATASVNAVSATVANSANLYTVLNSLLDVTESGSTTDKTILAADFVSGNTNLLANGGTAFNATNDGTFTLYVKTVSYTTGDGATVTVDVYRNFTITVQ